MEDPWGSPWSAESPPKIDLPVPPPSAHFSLDNHSQPKLPLSQEPSPWGEESDAWGGWNEGTDTKKLSSAWRKSPNLEPVASPASRQVSPGPWGRFGPPSPDARSRSRDRRSVVGEKEQEPFENYNKSDLRSDACSHIESPDEKEVVVRTSSDIPSEEEPTLDDKHRILEDQTTTPNPDEDDTGHTAMSTPSTPDQVDQAEEADARQPSKVQELVDMYDDIAKRNASLKPSTPHTPPMKRKNAGLTETEAEELLGINGIAHVNGSQAAIPFALGLDTEKESSFTNGSPVREDSLESDETSSSSPSSRTKLRVSFDVDLASLDKLFPSTANTAVQPEPVPDVIIDDTFTTISERKTWYRISRFGSARKHNYGDDENYVRISWKDSEVRDRTIRIVRRWMEEDSITGRVVGGRRIGAIGASMFNWDSKAPAVEIGELLGRKSRHSRNASITSKATEPSPTVSAFGWATAPQYPGIPPPSTTAQKHASLPPPAARPSFTSSRAVEPPLRPTSALPPPKDIKLLPSKTASTTKDEDDDEEDDDEWGEMVSSPLKNDFDGPSVEASILRSSTNKTNSEPILLPLRNNGHDIPAQIPTKAQEALVPSMSDAFADMELLSQGSAGNEEKTGTYSDISSELSSRSSTPTISQPPDQFGKLSSDVVNEPPQLENNERHDDEIVAEILRGLPDLSYMLQ